MPAITEDTRCVWCAKACNSGCSWSEELRPVEGWVAENTKHGFLVTECPEYVSERNAERISDDIDTEGMLALFEAFLRQIREDYVLGIDAYNEKNKNHRVQRTKAEKREAIERYLKKRSTQVMLQLSNVEGVINGLRMLARVHDAQAYNYNNFGSITNSIGDYRDNVYSRWNHNR